MSLPAYAPTSTSSYTPSNAAKNPNTRFYEEMPRSSLFLTPIHKSVYETLAEIYSIVTTLEMMENSFLKDYVTDKEKYTSTVMRLINQYNTLMTSLGKTAAHKAATKEILPGLSEDHKNFLSVLSEDLGVNAPLAIDRLISGIPTTITHMHKVVEKSTDSASHEEGNRSQALARLVAEATGNFITIMDALKLNYKTKLQLHPLLSNLVISLNDLVSRENGGTAKPVEFAGKSKLVSWLIRLNNLSDSEALSSEDIEVFLSDLDMAYKSFYDSLE